MLTTAPPRSASDVSQANLVHEQRPPEIDVEEFREAGAVLVDEWAEGGVGTGVVDEDVEAAEALRRELEARCRRPFVGDVRRETDRPGAERGGRLVGCLLGPRGEQHLGPCLHQRRGDRVADAS